MTSMPVTNYTPPTITSAPVTTYAAPIMSAPVTEIIAAPAVVEEVIRPVQTQQPRNLLAMGNVISERVITVEELADTGRFFEDEAVREPVRTV